MAACLLSPAAMQPSHCTFAGRLQLGKKFQRPEGMAGASGGVEQYARAQYMLQNLGLQVKPLPATMPIRCCMDR